jgi:hypothetical protein
MWKEVPEVYAVRRYNTNGYQLARAIKRAAKDDNVKELAWWNLTPLEIAALEDRGYKVEESRRRQIPPGVCHIVKWG